MNGTYVCKKCSAETSRDQLNSKGWKLCRECLSKYQKDYRENNKVRLSSMNRVYRLEIISIDALNSTRTKG